MKNIIIANDSMPIMVSDCDYEHLIKFIWHINDNKSRIYRSETGYHVNYSGRHMTKTITVANEIFKTNDVLYDHRDVNPYNCQRDNLRVCTVSQNNANKRKRKGTSSKYKGVCWVKIFNGKPYNKWNAYLYKNGKRYHLGFFDDEVLAAIAYDDAALIHHGEFARLNFPLYGA